MRLALPFALLAACAGSTPAVSAPSGPPKLDDLAWLAGTWHATDVDAHWQNVSGALYGVALDNAGGFEVNIIDDTGDDGKPAPITLLSIDNGRGATRFTLVRATPAEMEFHSYDGNVRVVRTEKGWRGEFAPPGGAKPVAFTMEPRPLASGAALEAADRAFEADTAKDGADGWMRWFAADGAVWHGSAPLEGEAIRASMHKTLAGGALHWTPVASGVKGEVGFTLGTFTFGPAGGPPVASGSYCTIWRKQADGSWKIVLDTGRPGE